MSYELNTSLRLAAEAYLTTNSEHVGPKYGRSKLKRSLDIFVSGLSSPFSLSILAIAGTAIWINDRHWPLVNVGNATAGYRVDEWKIRTMVPDAKDLEAEITQGRSLLEFKKGGMNDARVTPIGQVLRSTKLDEAPQMFNVLLGHLSLVGPRLPVESDWNFIYTNQDREPFTKFISLLKEKLKFGVTGFYTLFGRESLSDDDRYQLEVMYWMRQSFVADLRVIAATLPALLKGGV